MNIRTELFLGWRYFTPKRSAVSIITLISVIGVILGVAVLIVVLAVMTGFTDHLKNKLLETGSHGQVRKAAVYSEDSPRGTIPRFTEEESDFLVAEADKLKADAVPVLVAPVLLQVRESFNPKVMIAFDPAKDRNRIGLKHAMKSGRYSLKKDEVVVSDVIAKEFHLNVGDKLLLHAPSRLAGLIERDDRTGRYRASKEAEVYVPGEYTIVGTFSFGKYDYDRDILFLGLYEADDLFGLDIGDSTHLYVWVNDPFHMDAFTEDFRKMLWRESPTAKFMPWQEMHERILGVLQVEKNMQFFLLIFIVLVAAFSIANTLITTVIQKTKEIGLLKSMGASSFSIMRIFILQGLFVGLIGTAGGVVLGFLVVTYRMAILQALRVISGQDIFPKEIYLFNELPAHIVWGDVALISVISILLCTLGALIPAIRAAHLDPARALRYE